MAAIAPMISKPRVAAVFVDRDGTLIRDVGYLSHIDQLEILPGVPEAICLLRMAGLKVVVVTNQSAIARGLLDETRLAAIHEELRCRLARKGAVLDGIYYCPHHPTEGSGRYRVPCACRKPKPGMVERASLELGIDPSISYLVGDQGTDMELAFRIRATGIWIQTDRAGDEQLPRGCRIAEDLWQAALWMKDDFESKASAWRA